MKKRMAVSKGALLCVCFLAGAGAVDAQYGNEKKQDSLQELTPGRSNNPAQLGKPYVLLISADGFRYDYVEKFNAVNIKRLSDAGVRAKSMIPAFPSVTFPNHYTLATGMYPAHHGLVDNYFYDSTLTRRYAMNKMKEVTDGSWYGGEPLWVLSEKQQLLSASYYWVGSEAAVQGIRPTYWYHYREDIPIEDRITAVRNWLSLPEEKRPHLITFYFPEVDHEGHEHGPDHPVTAAAVQFIDKSIGRMQAMIDSLQLPVNIIFVSDHGMIAVDTINTIQIPVIDSTEFAISYSDMMAHIYSRHHNRQKIQALFKQLQSVADGYEVHLASNTPKRWKYNKKNDRYGRIGDIIVTPVYPRIFATGKKRVVPGRHGYDPWRHKEMHATFAAWGPQIKAGKTIGSFESIQVYRLVAALLGLKVDAEIDSGKCLARKLIK